MSACADFYIGTGPNARWLGHIAEDGSAAEMDEVGLFGDDGSDLRYVEATFIDIVETVVDDAWADEMGWGINHGDGPDRPDDLPKPAMVYAFVTGSIHVFEIGEDMNGAAGMLLVAVHHPNGARKVTEFAGLAI